MTEPPDDRVTGPVTGAARIDAIDVLRGAALPGILLMNVQSFAMPRAAYFNPTAYERPRRGEPLRCLRDAGLPVAPAAGRAPAGPGGGAARGGVGDFRRLRPLVPVLAGRGASGVHRRCLAAAAGDERRGARRLARRLARPAARAVGGGVRVRDVRPHDLGRVARRRAHADRDGAVPARGVQRGTPAALLRGADRGGGRGRPSAPGLRHRPRLRARMAGPVVLPGRAVHLLAGHRGQPRLRRRRHAGLPDGGASPPDPSAGGPSAGRRLPTTCYRRSSARRSSTATASAGSGPSAAPGSSAWSARCGRRSSSPRRSGFAASTSTSQGESGLRTRNSGPEFCPGSSKQQEGCGTPSTSLSGIRRTDSWKAARGRDPSVLYRDGSSGAAPCTTSQLPRVGLDRPCPEFPSTGVQGPLRKGG